jgi:hypothetical protein
MKYVILRSQILRGIVTKETVSNVWFQEEDYRPEKHWKATSDFAAFDTFEEAKAEQIKRIELRIDRKARELTSMREDLATLKALTVFKSNRNFV